MLRYFNSMLQYCDVTVMPITMCIVVANQLYKNLYHPIYLLGIHTTKTFGPRHA